MAKTMRAAERSGVKCVTASGGVTCNRGLRAELAKACEKRKLKLRLAERALCTDNAAMIGILAGRKLMQKAAETSLDAELMPQDGRWKLSVRGEERRGVGASNSADVRRMHFYHDFYFCWRWPG